MIGWTLFITLLILVIGVLWDISKIFGQAFGYPSSDFKWAIAWVLIVGMWMTIILSKFNIIHFDK